MFFPSRIQSCGSIIHMEKSEPSLFSMLHIHYMMGSPVPHDVLQSFLVERKSIVVGRAIHTYLIGFHLNCGVLGDHLIRLFASCGNLMEAELVFFTIAQPSVYTWQAIISAHANHGNCARTVELYTKMKESNVSSNKFILVGVLKAYGRLHLLEEGRHTHCSVINSGFDLDVLVGSTLIDMYAKCECLQEAHQVFDKLPNRNVVSWDAMMMGYVQYGRSDVALTLFDEMLKEKIYPTKVTYLCILKACGTALALKRGKFMHIDIIKYGFESDLTIGNTLIDMYAKSGSIDEACQVFECLSIQDHVSWGALISGCALHNSDYALLLFRRMHCNGMNANKPMFLCILKVCSNSGSWIETNLVHDLILRNGIILEKDIGNALLDAYAKCRCLQEAHKVFVSLPSRDIVSYGALISGCSLHGSSLVALEFFDSMKNSGIKPNKFIFPCVLRSCGTLGIIHHGMLMHKDVINDGFDSDLVVLNALVDMYAKCGSMLDAHKVFQNLPLKNVVSWSAIIAGYVQNEQYLCAIHYFERMQDEGIEPNKATYLSYLKACGSARSLAHGRLLHERLMRSGLELDIMISNTLVDMYCKCGSLDAAREVFDQIQIPDEITWNVMISGYVQSGLDLDAIEHFERMVREGHMPREFTFSSILKACGSLRSLRHLKCIHDHIIRTSFTLDAIIESALVDAYAKCGSLEDARRLFDASSESNQNEVRWGMIIAGYTRHGHSDCAFELFQNMQERNLKELDITALSCVLKACGDMGALGRGHSIHDLIMLGALEEDNIIGSSLVDMYAQCGNLNEARKVFDGLPQPDIVLWGSIIGAYAEQGSIVPAWELFQKMQEYGLKPNSVIYLSLLKACCNVGGLEYGKSIHAQIIQVGFEFDVFVGNTLVDMYSKCGELGDASQVFGRLPNQDVISWTSLMAGYSELGHGDCALEMFERMQHEGIHPGKATFLCALKACTSLASLKQGRSIHHQIIMDGLEVDTFIANTLVNMYARCGILEEAQRVFSHLTHLGIASWSVILEGLSQNGNKDQAEILLKSMQEEGIQPHGIMYSNVISSCSHAGRVDEGQHHFALMQEVSNIEPSKEHFSCVVDLLGRAGCLKQAYHFLHTMPFGQELSGWMSLLTSCKTYGNVDIGRQCFNEIVHIDPDAAAGYMLMSDIYANAQMWEEYREMQDLRKGRCVWKKPGKARIVVDNQNIDFVVGQKGFADYTDISIYLDRLSSMIKQEGYVPCVDPCVDVEVDVIISNNSNVENFAAKKYKMLCDLYASTCLHLFIFVTTYSFTLSTPKLYTIEGLFVFFTLYLISSFCFRGSFFFASYYPFFPHLLESR